MWIPWRNKTGLSKAAAILATTLSIATVSCGLNWALAMASSTTPWARWALGFLVIAGWAELVVMVASVVGLLIVLVIWLVSKGHAPARKDSND